MSAWFCDQHAHRHLRKSHLDHLDHLDQTVFKKIRPKCFIVLLQSLFADIFSHQVHRALKIISTARNCTLSRENLIFKASPQKDRLQIIHKQRVFQQRKGSCNISHKPEYKLHWKKKITQNHKIFWIGRDTHQDQVPTLNWMVMDQTHDLVVISTISFILLLMSTRYWNYILYKEKIISKALKSMWDFVLHKGETQFNGQTIKVKFFGSKPA